ncbi:MAG TPA: hypothetical protein VFU45_03630, partial [Gemmatimonadales bacterium]|nr:hypothetical protein [Gemmatimonadales bacterium]
QIVVLDSGEVGALAESDLRMFIGSLQSRSATVGVHVLLGHAGRVAELRAWYAGWRHLPAEDHGAVLVPPTCQNDSDTPESLQHTLLDARD